MNDLLEQASKVVVIQPENPDADSLASSLALEQILGDLEIEVHLYCAVSIPRHLRHIEGWDRVSNDMPNAFDFSIIVDTSQMTLLEKAFNPQQQPIITSRPIVIIDHHDVESDIAFDHINESDPHSASTGEVIFHLAKLNSWKLNLTAMNMIVISIMADTLGLTTSETTARTFRTVADLVDGGVQVNVLDDERRKMFKRPAEITEYKGRLLQRIEYSEDGTLASITIPWEEIEEFSDKHNPSNLVIEDMRNTEKVRVAIAYKLYSDGHITGKIRTNNDAPIADKLAASQGGGGHSHASGFKIYDAQFDEIRKSISDESAKLLREHDEAS